jgi:DNA modification methylase
MHSPDRRSSHLKELMSSLFDSSIEVADSFHPSARAVILAGDAARRLREVASETVSLIITSPPYNIGKAYESQTTLEEYFATIEPTIDELIRVLAPNGSLCWQVGNYVDKGEVYPLDILYYPFFKKKGLKLRNRIVWTFDHGLHASKRLSGRYETMLWFTKSDEYVFNLDPIRVPSKYPGKRNYKPGENYGKPSGNPLGKNPSDIWRIVVSDWESLLWDIPNVKANHPEKTLHPCQFPIELVERCVLALTDEGDFVLDPYSGVGSAALAALKNGRRSIACEKEDDYIRIARERIEALSNGTLPYRTLGKPIFKPTGREKVSQRPEEWDQISTI